MAQRHMDRLTSFDTSFLANESPTGTWRSARCWSARARRPATRTSSPTSAAACTCCRACASASPVPPLRPRPALLGRRSRASTSTSTCAATTLPAPGSDDPVPRAVGRDLSPPLDRSRPLWELWLVEGFEDDRFAIVYKTHHALADGISAVDIGVLLFDVEPNIEPVRERQPWEPADAALAQLGLVGRALRRHRGDRRARASAGCRRALRKPAPRREARLRRRRRALGGHLGPDQAGAQGAAQRRHRPRTAASPGTRCDLDEFKQIKNALGGTVNDVTLAVAAGALRRWLQDRERRDRRARAAGPGPGLGPHRERARRARQQADRDARPAAGRHRRPRRAPAHVTEAMDALKASKQPLGAEAIWGLNDWFREFAPPVLLGPTATINFSTRLFNLLVTNFPGPQIPFYVLGRELVGVYPVGFLAQRPRAGDRDLQLQRPDGLRPARRPRLDRRPRARSAPTSTRRWRSSAPPPRIASPDDGDRAGRRSSTWGRASGANGLGRG